MHTLMQQYTGCKYLHIFTSIHIYLSIYLCMHTLMQQSIYTSLQQHIFTTGWRRLIGCMCVCVCVRERECVCMCVPQQTDHLHIFFVNFRFLNTIFQPCLHTNMKTYSRSHVCVSVRVCVYVCVCMCVCVCVYVCVWPPCDFHKYFF